MSLLLRVWRGEYSLGQQFWLAHVAVCVGFRLLVSLLTATLGQLEALRPAISSDITPLLIFAILLTLVIWSLTGLWRAAGRYELWQRMLARSWVILIYGLAYAYFIVLTVIQFF